MATLRRSSSSYGGFADGIIIRGMPLLTLYPGNVYWVDSNGGGGSKGTFNHPCLTVGAAHDLVTTDNGDIIVVKPGHAETLTATVDFSKSGFAIIGLGFGDNRPTITMSATTADDGWDFAGDDVVVYNIKFVDGDGGATGALPCINCSGDNMHIEGCFFSMGADMSTAVTFDTSEKHGFTFINNTLWGKEAGPDVGVRMEVEHHNAYFAGNKYLFDLAVGCDTGCIVFVSGVGYSHLIEDEFVSGLADGEQFINQAIAQSMSLVRNCSIVGVDASDNLGVTTAAGFAYQCCAVLEEATGGPSTYGSGLYRPYAVTPTAL